MCTVVFIPMKNKILFASLRDENPVRKKAIRPRLQNTEACSFLAPVDPEGGGTWVGVNRNGCVVVLLNGGFTKHIRKSHYLKSRGQIVSGLLMDETPLVMWSLLDLGQIEPFTLIVWLKGRLYQLVWDGKLKYRTILPLNQPQLWSSATLYNADSRKHRSNLFRHWISGGQKITPLSLFTFFQSVEDAFNGFLVNRGEKIKTLSYTTIVLTVPDKAAIRYQDLADGKISRNSITPATTLAGSLLNCCPIP